MKNFVISLSTAVKRREHISAEFGRQDIEFQFFDAVVPETMESMVRELGLDLTATDLKKSEVSCLLSHVALWKKAVDDNLDYIAIFEDDIYLGSQAKTFLSDPSWIPKDYNIIKLEAFYRYITVLNDKDDISIAQRKLAVLKSRHMGCGGYILSNNGAANLLKFIKKYKKLIPIDHIVFNDYMLQGNDRIFQMVPALCIQDFILNKCHEKFPSHLEDDRRVRKGEVEKIIKPKISFVQKVKREISRPFLELLKFINFRYQQLHGQIIIRMKFK
ncbi:glycosyltransferase family 25 protein [Acinetobacter sp. ANC 4648]|uniref:glycosyltransferase family 25 protein n=1 Tax=Acinetobacter sp. ANC 4648 TaxID=1977875 RepID=UPI000A32C301|nr:glycosyltransferase family 25 protein [Acinetobacter sp. ANC 4648]OTG84715.1 glycosyltransferase LpsA [Acinetobacter sp. ANC 4648]